MRSARAVEAQVTVQSVNYALTAGLLLFAVSVWSVVALQLIHTFGGK